MVTMYYGPANCVDALLGTAGLIFLSTSMLFIWFIILPGVTDDTPFRKTYYLRADTSGITGARDISQWTYFFICGLDNKDCGDAHPAIPFGFAWDSNAQNVPPGLGGSHGSHTTSFHYFFMWRFGWVFLLMTLFFEVLAFFTAFLACCGRLGAALAFVVSGIALFFYTLAVTIITYEALTYNSLEYHSLMILQRHLCRGPQPLPRRRPLRPDWRLRIRLPLGLLRGPHPGARLLRPGHPLQLELPPAPPGQFQGLARPLVRRAARQGRLLVNQAARCSCCPNNRRKNQNPQSQK